jgi:hypothetical protein
VTQRVRLDLNFEDFQRQLFELDADELRQVLKTFRKLSGMDWVAVGSIGSRSSPAKATSRFECRGKAVPS